MKPLELRLRTRIDQLSDRVESLEAMLKVSMEEEERLANLADLRLRQIRNLQRERDKWRDRVKWATDADFTGEPVA